MEVFKAVFECFATSLTGCLERRFELAEGPRLPSPAEMAEMLLPGEVGIAVATFDGDARAQASHRLAAAR